MADLTIKQGEAKIVKFTVTDCNSNAVNLSSASANFVMKLDKNDSSYLIEKVHSDFNTASSASGIMKVTLNATDTNQRADSYKGELYIWTSSSNKDKSDDIDIDIEETVFN